MIGIAQAACGCSRHATNPARARAKAPAARSAPDRPLRCQAACGAFGDARLAACITVVLEAIDPLPGRERVAAAAREVRVGTEGEFDVGPITTTSQLRVVEDQLEDALARGARVVVGGRRASDAGYPP